MRAEAFIIKLDHVLVHEHLIAVSFNCSAAARAFNAAAFEGLHHHHVSAIAITLGQPAIEVMIGLNGLHDFQHRRAHTHHGAVETEFLGDTRPLFLRRRRQASTL